MGLGRGFCLLLVASWAFRAADAQPPFPKLLGQAREAEKAKDYAKAEQVYREIVKLRPKDPVAHQNLGLAFFLQGKFAEAVPSLEKSVQIQPKLFGATLYLGISYYRLNHFSQALPVLERAHSLNPKDPMSRYWLGAAHLALKEFPPAIAELESAVQAAPRDQETLYLLARAYAEYSAHLLERLLRVAPDSVPAHRVRAEDAMAQGMPRPAVVELEKAVALRPGDSALLQLLKAARNAAETSAEPVIVRPAKELPLEQLALLLRDKPGDPDALYLIGKSYEARSSELGHKLFELYPNSYRVRLMRGEAYEKSDEQDYEKALAEYRKALELKPDLPGVHYAVGRVLWKMRRWEEAVPYLRKELEKNPHHALANYYLGSSYLFLENTGAAIRCLEAAVREQPGLAQAHRDLGRALARMGRHDEALASFRRVLETDAEDPSVHALMAASYRGMGRMEEARQAAEMSRQLSARKNQPVQ